MGKLQAWGLGALAALGLGVVAGCTALAGISQGELVAADGGPSDATATDQLSPVEAGDDGTTYPAEGGPGLDAVAPPGDSSVPPHDGGTKDAATSDAGGCSGLQCPSGCVADPMTDIHNCGTCGNDCTALPNVTVSGLTCAGGKCAYSCAPGFADCAKMGTGCGTDVSKQGNCGSCGKTCSGATPVCTGTAGCGTGCTGSQTLCGTSCSDTTSDPNNCGSCGNVCTTAVANAQPTCNGNMCGYSCNPTYVACLGGCILGQPNTTAGVFVAPGGSGGACGSESAPCGTIAQALAVVASSAGSKNLIYLSNATYTEQVTLPAGITIQGGWLDTGGTWTPDCVANPQTLAIIQAPPGSASAVTASYTGASRLDTLTVQNKTAAATGQSLYGVFATGTGTSLTLNNVDVIVAAGGAGAPGTGGANGGVPPACTAPSDGVSGKPGTPGAGAMPGTYGAGGYTPASGGNGSAGTNGDNGGAPTAPLCVDYPSYACNDLGDGNGCYTGDYMSCGKAGLCGPGGLAGSPGGGASGGGSSIGIFAWGAAVTLDTGAITPGAGGAGGPGGPPGMGSPGGTGPSGMSDMIDASCSNLYNAKTMGYICKAGTLKVGDPGGAGTTGGNGGNGGPGGGGSGGDSYCWYVGGGAVVTSTASCTPGAAGLGGSQGGGSSQGATGATAAHN